MTDLPEAAVFDRSGLKLPNNQEDLNLDQKLGHLYEDALTVLLQNSLVHELLDRNLQISDEQGNTVGELDFLLHDIERDQLVHLELATKFYLGVKTGSGLALPGPDARDDYFRKLKRLREHQLVLTKKHRETLPRPYRDKPLVARQLIYGCLFDHVDETEITQPDYVSPTCRRGRWLTINQCRGYFPDETRFHVIPKYLWPVPIELLQDITLDQWQPTQDLNRCVMVRVNEETTPYFITPNGYPNQPGAT